MNQTILPVLDAQLARFLSTYRPRTTCDWNDVLTEIVSTFNDLVRLGYTKDDLNRFIEQSLSSVKTYSIPKAKLAKLQDLLVIPQEDEEDEDEDQEEDEEEDEEEDQEEDDEETTISPALVTISKSAQSSQTPLLPIIGGFRRR